MQALDLFLFVQQFFLLEVLIAVRLGFNPTLGHDYLASLCQLEIFVVRDDDSKLPSVLLADFVGISLRIDVEQVEVFELDTHLGPLVLGLLADVTPIDLLKPCA